MNDRALYLAIRLISRIRELESVLLCETEVRPEEGHVQRTRVVAGVLGDEEGISDPISVQLVLAAMPEFDPLAPPQKQSVQDFAAFLENQFHLSDTPRE